jgi:hypothetical protein
LFWLQNISPNLDHPTSPTYYIYIYIVKEEEEKILKKKKKKTKGWISHPQTTVTTANFKKKISIFFLNIFNLRNFPKHNFYSFLSSVFEIFKKKKKKNRTPERAFKIVIGFVILF